MRFGLKMMIGFIVLLSLTFGIGGSFLISASFGDSLGRAEDAAMSSHRLTLYTLASVSGGDAQNADSELISALNQLDAQNAQSWVSLRLSDGSKTVYQSNNPASFDDSLLPLVDAGHNVSRISRAQSGAYLLQIAGQIETPAGRFYLESIYDISAVYSAQAGQFAIYHRLFAIVIVLGAAISWLLSYWLTAPLRKLSRATRAIASGDLSSRAKIKSRDEIGVLASDFNDMASRLESNITQLRDAMHRQEEFMGGFAHELKTPMTSIIGYSDLLRSHALSDDDRREAANYIFTEGRRLEALSLKLLDLIVLRRGDFTLVPASVAGIAQEVRRLMSPVLTKRDIKLTLKCDKRPCMLEPDLVKSLLINIVDNSRKAIENGGEIRIDSETTSDGCVIHVADSGRGMPEDVLAKITDAFYRVDKARSRAQGGVGLGLALCREIALLHGGGISFESEPGRGTRVTVELRGGAVGEE